MSKLELEQEQELIIPPQLALWFSMYQHGQDMHCYLLATQPRDSLGLDISGRLPELSELVASDTTGLVRHVYYGGLVPSMLPVICLACKQQHGSAIGGRLVNHCGIGSRCRADFTMLKPQQIDRIQSYYDMASHTDYGENVVALYYLTWLKRYQQLARKV